MVKISSRSVFSVAVTVLVPGLICADNAVNKVAQKSTSPAAAAPSNVVQKTPQKPAATPSKEINLAKVETVSQNLKFGCIDSYAAMQNSAEGKKITQEIESKRVKMAQEIQVEEQKITKAVKEFQEKNELLSESAREKKQSELIKMRREFENMVKGAEEEMKLSFQQINERMSREISDAAYELGRKGFDVIIDVASGRVMYASEKANETGDLIAIMDKNYEKKQAVETKANQRVTA